MAPNTHTKVNTTEKRSDNGKESVKSNFKMELSIRDRLRTKNTMAKVDSLTQTETSTKVTGSTEKLTITAASLKSTKVLSTTENGTWMPCTDRESFNGTLENVLTKVISKMDKEQVKEFTERVLNVTLDLLKTDNSMEMVLMFSIIHNHSRKRTKWSMKEYFRITRS